MTQVEKIVAEQDPLLREIWAMGYTDVIKNECLDTIQLINSETKYVKTLTMSEFTQNTWSLDYMTAILIDGEEHRWIKEAGGSAKRFRELIKPS